MLQPLTQHTGPGVMAINGLIIIIKAVARMAVMIMMLMIPVMRKEEEEVEVGDSWSLGTETQKRGEHLVQSPALYLS